MIKFKRKAKAYKKIELPHIVYIGDKILPRVGEVTENYKNVLVVTGRKTSKIAGNKVKKITGADKLIVQKADYENIRKVIEKASGTYDAMIGVGGGSVMDTAKYSAFKLGIDYIAVPTNTSNDGIASPIASIKNEKRESLKARMPKAIVVDTNIIKKSPKMFFRAGFGDAIGKYTAVKDWNLGRVVKKEYYGDYASSLSEMISKIVMNNAVEIGRRTDRGVNTLIESLVSAGAAMGIAGSSRPASGSEHKFSHALDLIAKKPALHGFQVGIGTIIMSYFHGANWRRVKNSLQAAKCPVTAKQIGMDEDIFLKALMKAKEIRPERYTIIEHINFDRKTAKAALEATGVV
jgi:glycerol-1-phosphate dehydrogenase [NAD(P)+]